MDKIPLNLLHLSNYPIFKQLQLEEALLRANTENWCIINDGTPDPTIIMGISGKKQEHVATDTTLPIIQRFSGGGTVVVNKDTCFISFIMQEQLFPFSANPDNIFCWSDKFYRDVFNNHPYQLTDRDYTFDNRKFGGNAQYIRKDRWLHHSTLLWDFQPDQMAELTIPNRQPQYRQNRPHSDFLCSLKQFFPDRNSFWKRVKIALNGHFKIKEKSLEKAEAALKKEHRKATKKLPIGT